MSEIIKNLFIVFFIINAIFWSLFPHRSHCEVVAHFTKECPSHTVHLTFGIISFFVALIIAQYDYLKSKLN
jgi:hypothetical protein